MHDAKVTQNGTLMIKNAENNQRFEGNYTCEASNSAGKKSTTAQLTICGNLVVKLEIYIYINPNSGNSTVMY